jgi:hypothetical protein
MQLDVAVARADRDRVHKALMKMIVREGLPLRLVRAPSLREFIRVLQSVPVGYTPPAYDTTRTTLLQQAVADVDMQLEAWNNRTLQTGVTLTSDGWSDANNRPLLNLLAVNPKGAKFLDAINTEGQQKTGEYISRQLIVGIELVGAENVVSVVTDNAAACKAAGAIIMDTYDHIFWSPCVAHVCDLALEDIFKIDEFQDIYTSTKEYVIFIRCV